MKFKLDAIMIFIKIVLLFLLYGCAEDSFLKNSGISNSENHEETKDFYTMLCHNGNVDGCNSLGDLYFEGKGVSQNYYKAGQLFHKTCANKSGYGCRLSGNIYEYGHNMEISYKKALEYYKKACDYEDGAGCMNVVNTYRFGIGTKENLQEALNYSKKACDLNSDNGCKTYEELKMDFYIKDLFYQGTHCSVFNKIKEVMKEPNSYKHVKTSYHFNKDKNTIDVKTDFIGKFDKDSNSRHTIIATVDLGGNILYFDVMNN